jgi:hypothetical protein
MTTWPLDFGPCFGFQKDELLRTLFLGTSVDRDKREPKPQTRPAPVPPHGEMGLLHHLRQRRGVAIL